MEYDEILKDLVEKVKTLTEKIYNKINDNEEIVVEMLLFLLVSEQLTSYYNKLIEEKNKSLEKELEKKKGE